MALPPRWLSRHVLWPLHERLRHRPTRRWLRTLRKSDRLDAEFLQILHDDFLVRQLKRVARVVPYYRERVDAEKVNAPEDIARFPVMDRQAIHEAGERLLAEDWEGPRIKSQTGGSSGEPLHFWTDPEREAVSHAAKFRARGWWGVPGWHRETHLWGSPVETGRHDAVRDLAGKAIGYQLLNAFDLNDATFASFRPVLENGRCDCLYGYASVLARYARWLLENDEPPIRVGPRLIVATAETLLEEDRALISRVLEAPVANEYGSRDGGLIAHEAPDGMHLLHDITHVEVHGPDGSALPPGEIGEVVLTHLHAQAFPIVRYRIGDRIRLDPEPPAGRGAAAHPRVAELAGRATDLLEKADGSEVHALALIYVLRELPGVARFRCTQHDRLRTSIAIVPTPDLDRSRLDETVIARVRQVLGAEVEVAISLVDDLPALPSGKHRFVVRE